MASQQREDYIKFFLAKIEGFDLTTWEKPHAEWFKKSLDDAVSKLANHPPMDRMTSIIDGKLGYYDEWSACYSRRAEALERDPDSVPSSYGCSKCRIVRTGQNVGSKAGCTMCGPNGIERHIERSNRLNRDRSATALEIPISSEGPNAIRSENHRPWNYRENTDILVRATYEAARVAHPDVDAGLLLCRSVSAVRSMKSLCPCKQWHCICLGDVVREKIDEGYETDPDTDETAAAMLSEASSNPGKLGNLLKAVNLRQSQREGGGSDKDKLSKFTVAVRSLAEALAEAGTPDADSPLPPGDDGPSAASPSPSGGRTADAPEPLDSDALLAPVFDLSAQAPVDLFEELPPPHSDDFPGLDAEILPAQGPETDGDATLSLDATGGQLPQVSLRQMMEDDPFWASIGS